MALEKAIRESGIQTTGTIFNRMVQVLGYADDLDIAGRSFRAVEEAFLALERAAGRLGLVINEAKTKYMVTGEEVEPGTVVHMGPYTFEQVNQFTYLGSLVGIHGGASSDIQSRIARSNRCFFGLRRHLRSSLISRSTKLQLYKTLIRPVLTYGAESWTISREDENRLLIHERKILRCIYGGVFDGENWRRRTNQELATLTGEPDVVKVIRLSRLRWAGHVARMDDSAIPRKTMDEVIYGGRRVGRPKLRWQDGIAHDARVLLGVRNWKAAALDRDGWRKLIEEAQTQ